MPGFEMSWVTGLLSTRFPSSLYLLFALIASFALIHQFSIPFWYHRPQRSSIRHSFSSPHPINSLIWNAEEEWRRLRESQTHDVRAAAREYRRRRGRHPPPGFDKWFYFAKENNAVIVEDFFDRIYDDLAPYWAFNPSDLRQQAASLEHRVVVRDHKTSTISPGEQIWVPIWTRLIESIQKYLPDVVVPLNVMDEPRIIVPFEKIREYESKGRATRNMPKPTDVVQNFTKLPETKTPDPPYDPEYEGPGQGPYWKMVIRGCPEDSAARTQTLSPIDFAKPLPPQYHNYLNFSSEGYVSNFSHAKNLCNRPELQVLHGNFIEPISISTSQKLFPLFGGSKLPVNNEILLPAAMYFAENTIWSGDEQHGGAWALKANKLVWRGSATGGRNKEENWRGFHRHRFVAMVNATAVRLAETGQSPSPNFALPNYNIYHLAQTGRDGHIADLLEKHSDAGFTDLVCFPDQKEPTCPYTSPFFAISNSISMPDQYKMKYLADIDGNSFSGRYRGFLLSSSLPFKSTLYNEWHDSRLVPWAHFVPMDSTYADIYGLMEFFFGHDGGPGRDEVARDIALDGKAWAEKVLRREDMKIYTYRLLLEYARVCDDAREKIGYVGDLLTKSRVTIL
ncbi:hypothetical protein PAAG_04137 [Paracoccidioides lutzii Pb01]|uniref:Glycosyl transferase CAP10 domain-containing protein n=1 Tax=Paracoccidioides lutzii (strain ATCC MYA-826 / Pb01) TaxID=502779 RepID=C1H043_PARBA|nr:hypothetical protein PAAG_04137 [Paracoccidioides lutzii Pb01]EEH33084.1 hypothetical protein PAAG_04137 [Paracoccidioides lutzii Pb01]